eukprot:768616-Hanusia_phi.AAC.4
MREEAKFSVATEAWRRGDVYRVRVRNKAKKKSSEERSVRRGEGGGTGGGSLCGGLEEAGSEDEAEVTRFFTVPPDKEDVDALKAAELETLLDEDLTLD